MFYRSKYPNWKGCLINTGAQIYNEVKIIEFTEVNPSAVLLGKVEFDSFCSIGENITILPGIKLWDSLSIEVVIHNVEDGKTVVGIPGREF
ncbi:hypothetical protein [Algoriphagus limi]|uniref:Uncharacterized protein n=1 Tax=Algoriphagus limi TaxID=2975273 RepID=A0ABT2G165_9BACT|nr:hypothetical protein [Algoriphagus limi]MCS5489018.1 hypothetical protein [Algoriphagus limi]